MELFNNFKLLFISVWNKGIFGIDIFMPSHELITNTKIDKIDILDFQDSRNNTKLNILESMQYNSKTEVNHITWEFVNQSQEIQFKYDFDMRLFFPDTLNRLLVDSKFHIDHFFGNYQFQKFNERSEKQIYLCSK